LPSPSSLAIILLVTVLSYFVASTFFYGKYTVPLPSYKSGFQGSEGFTIPPPTLLPSPEQCISVTGISILNAFSAKSSTEEGERDLLELTHMINKLSCFQSDLTSAAYTVSATLKQPFITTHDVEPISETTGRCFAKTLPPRDLDIAMDKWTDRGNFLIRRLCTSYSLTNSDVAEVEANFQTFIRGIYDTARESCLQKEPLDVSARGPRDPAPFSARTRDGEYTGYY